MRWQLNIIQVTNCKFRHKINNTVTATLIKEFPIIAASSVSDSDFKDTLLDLGT